MHPYFIFKDAITVFVFLILFCFFVFFSPNTLGQGWPILIKYPFALCAGQILLILQCAICWKYLKIKNYYKTIYIRGLKNNIKRIVNPIIVKYYNNEYNQQITKLLKIIKNNYKFLFTLNVGQLKNDLKEVGISETTRTQKYLLKNNEQRNEKLENSSIIFNMNVDKKFNE